VLGNEYIAGLLRLALLVRRLFFGCRGGGRPGADQSLSLCFCCFSRSAAIDRLKMPMIASSMTIMAVTTDTKLPTWNGWLWCKWYGPIG
jgi:hypothetical protein